MHLNFDNRYIGIQFNTTSCYELTGYTENELIALTGIFGYSSDFEIACFEGIYPNLRIAIECNALTLQIELQIGEGIIQNELMICHTPGEGIGLKVFSNQTDAAVDAGFSQIRCLAVGRYKVIEKWNGYITWGKFGFIIDNYFQNKFVALLKEYNRKETTLAEILSTKDGEKFWMEKGMSWPGKFDLYAGSESRVLLQNYKRKKGLL